MAVNKEELVQNDFIIDYGRIEDIGSNIEPAVLYQDLLKRIRDYHPSEDFSSIRAAYELAYSAHEDQLRKNGEPYIIHPLYVAIILADLQMDKETIIAGLLHDVVEDTVLTTADIEAKFGSEVAKLVAGVTKVTKDFKYSSKEEEQAVNLRNMFLVMAQDIRVIIIKLADRLHNMRTLEHMPPHKQYEKAKETMEIYAPFAQRLGIGKIKVELEDLSFKYLEPEAYDNLVNQMVFTKEEREDYIANIVMKVKHIMDDADIHARVDGRVKHLFSIYRKMKNQGKTLDQIYDLFAVRIIVEDEEDLYTVLGYVHKNFKPMNNRFKDYVANPKENGYKSIHTTVFDTTDAKAPFEIQIRTREMHKEAEYGIASHWKYKEESDGKKVSAREVEKSDWLRSLTECLEEEDNEKFLSLIHDDLDIFSENIYCSSPKGRTIELPSGSTPIDFAYAIHTDVGNKMVGAMVNNVHVGNDYTLKNGDIVEIITSNNSNGPSRDWLKKVRSTQAKNKINQWFKRQQKDENIVKGREKVQEYCKQNNIDLTDVLTDEYKRRLLDNYSFKDWDALLAAIGHGGIKEGQAINRILAMYEKDHPKVYTNEEVLESIRNNSIKYNKPGQRNGIIVNGTNDVEVRFGKCCNPIPGDSIIGFITRGRGVTIHRKDCINMSPEVLSPEDRQRIIVADWQEEALDGVLDNYLAEITIFANERTGLLYDVTKIFTEADTLINMLHTNISKKGVATMRLSFRIRSKEELDRLCAKLSGIDGVIEVERTK
ncbi:MAG: bifunctional (p)ppGpp synthetase/guanosine-3',5'-bis(diphosphate) 3'-pyrophosphohydrolase [Lachnospiraceae bacterium]|nr:bifunctional (p)ppGpp synthetase/guanosine-3',5'-bis(diphosphate) 3'-pyrophosphohydrolase [Lachnospiraceae bacterium]